MEEERIVTTYQTYYKKMKIDYTEKREELVKQFEELDARTKELHKNITSDLDTYGKAVHVDLAGYKELAKNVYENGAFYRVIKNALLRYPEDYQRSIEFKELVEYVGKKKDMYDIEPKIKHYDKCLALSLEQYRELLKTFYDEVTRQMVLEGYGYRFEGRLGYVVINRCRKYKGRRSIDIHKTKERKKELEAQGIQVWDKDQAAFAKKHGLEYNAVSATVYQNVEAFYEVVLVDCNIPNGNKLKFRVPNTVSHKIEERSYEDMIRNCNRDVNEICKLPIDFRKKAYLCMEVDKTLYKKYIRNEEQVALSIAKVSRKDR